MVGLFHARKIAGLPDASKSMPATISVSYDWFRKMQVSTGFYSEIILAASI